MATECCCQSEEARKTGEDTFTAPASTHGGNLRIALAGNPNCGKTTLFNTYTGARQHVGNYPGVTVDRKEGPMTVNGRDITLVDIPGTYSLTAYSQEELVARSELSFGMVDAVIDIADASALQRSMLLTVQIMEMGMPVVLACNMMDEARKAGVHINMKKLSQKLGAPCMPLVARTGEGSREIMQQALKLGDKGRQEPLRLSYGPEIDAALAPLEKRLTEENVLTNLYHPHWTAIKLLEGDQEVIKTFRETHGDIAEEILEHCAATARQVREVRNATCESVITDARYGYIRGLLADVVTQDAGKDRLALTDKLDKILTNALLGPIIMIGVLYAMFWITIELGAYPQGWVEEFFGWLGGICDGAMEDGALKSLIVDGIIGGVGGVVSFVPLIAIMFALIAFIEDSGYMARISYMMDRIFRMFGLHGASVMPYIIAGGIAGGCAIPGAMATRTLRSPKEKLATLLTLPYMACGAKVPVFLLLIAAFFPENPATAFFMILGAGWISALLVALLLRHTIIKGDATPFVMELPPYRLPTIFAILLHMWERTWMYLKKAGTVILAISIIIWAALTYPSLPEDMEAPYTQKIEQLTAAAEALPEGSEERTAADEAVAEAENALAEAALQYSYAGRIGVALEPYTQVAGFSWQTNIALVAGVAAKEAVVSTLGTAYSMGEQDPEDAAPLGERLKQDPSFDKATALSLILFVLMYSPCFVALVVIKSEAGSWGWLLFSMIFNTALAFAVATAAYHIGKTIFAA
ncbi:MAG TPA: ferrous iron transport protein B [Candidatus Desulfovibrio intestinipullorum]|uniref:Ferrous iron transport protein B n=1 Tax=Candidatus Desulfovibrio intestinipullorum TaxID=2838536 RepID=A0A9D1TQB4_9BACT|nr:ferrous iron transport protein B [Candidatus Desulfovibrio intestinipullorum]